jgi:LSD1 subclass zinc finger protein
VLIECGYCGAPLDVREGARLIKCRYCGTVSERARQKTMSQVTPPDFRPPPRWTPPAHVPANSAQELAYKSSRAGWIAGGVILMFVLIPLLGLGVKLMGEAGIGGPQGPELAKLSLAQNAKGLASSLSGRQSGTSVYVPLSSPLFEFVTFSYKEQFPDHPTSFYFSGKKGSTQLDPKVKAALAQKLELPLDENGSWRWEHVWLNTDPKTGSVGGNVDTEIEDGKPNPYWRRQLQALWQIVVSAAYNQNVGPDKPQARELLGTGYPFLDLAKLSSLTPVESAEASVAKLFPGSVFSARSGVSAHVAVDHPLFRTAELAWKNEKNATLYQVGLRSKPGPGGYEGRHDSVAKCLTPTFGAPEVNVTDYLKKKQDYSFTRKGLRIYVSSTWLYFYADGPLAPDEWARLLTAINACRS